VNVTAKPGRAVAYVDGGCEPNPGQGAAAAVVITDEYTREVIRGEEVSTNQRAEILAAIIALEALAEPSCVEIVSDSQYLFMCARGEWKRKKNTDLWRRLEEAAKEHEVAYTWVRGHDGNPGNERAHEMVARVLEGRPCARERYERRWLICTQRIGTRTTTRCGG
jgi:ribonuclease HI